MRNAPAIVVCCLLAVGCGGDTERRTATRDSDASPAPQEESYYFFRMETILPESEDSVVSVAGPTYFGEAPPYRIIYVNGSPIGGHDLALRPFYRISDLLRVGKNTVSIRGKTDFDERIQVLRSRRAIADEAQQEVDTARLQGSSAHVVAEKVFVKGGTEFDMTFEVTGLRTCSNYSELPQEGAERKRMEEEAWAFLERLESAIRERRGRDVAVLAVPDQDPNKPAECRVSQDELRDYRKAWEELIADPALELVSTTDDLELVWGRQTVLVKAREKYDGVDPIQSDRPSSFICRRDESLTGLPHLVLVRVNGRWQVGA